MRVVGGIAKGRRLSAPKHGAIRITADRIKESLFDILGPLQGVAFLDLYAGAGSVGIEALSRGAARCVFVEHDHRHATQIERNLARTRLQGGEVITESVDTALKRLAERREKFDIIFADPPYLNNLVVQALEALSKRNLLEPDGVVVIEHSLREPCEGSGILRVADRRDYGDTVLTFLNARV